MSSSMLTTHIGKHTDAELVASESNWTSVVKPKNKKIKKKSNKTKQKTEEEKELSDILCENSYTNNPNKPSRNLIEMQKQVREFKNSHLQNEIMSALREFDQKEEKQLQQIEKYIINIEQNKDTLGLLFRSNTSKEINFWLSFMEYYDLQTYLDIEHFSDKGWYTVCPSCEWCIYPGMDEHHCTCSTVLHRNRIYYAL